MKQIKYTQISGKTLSHSMKNERIDCIEKLQKSKGRNRREDQICYYGDDCWRELIS